MFSVLPMHETVLDSCNDLYLLVCRPMCPPMAEYHRSADLTTHQNSQHGQQPYQACQEVAQAVSPCIGYLSVPVKHASTPT